MSVTERFFQGLSIVAHPLLMPLLLMLLLWQFTPIVLGPLPENYFWRLFMLVTLVTFIIPAFSMLFLRVSGAIRSLHMAELKDRRLPFIFVSIIYCFVAWMFWFRMPFNTVINALFVSLAANVVLLTVISFYWKISIHAAAVGGMVGILFALWQKYPAEAFYYPFLGMILMAGLVMTARLYLNAHTPNQILGGSVVGLCTCLLGIILLA